MRGVGEGVGCGDAAAGGGVVGEGGAVGGGVFDPFDLAHGVVVRDAGAGARIGCGDAAAEGVMAECCDDSGLRDRFRRKAIDGDLVLVVHGIRSGQDLHDGLVVAVDDGAVGARVAEEVGGDGFGREQRGAA